MYSLPLINKVYSLVTLKERNTILPLWSMNTQFSIMLMMLIKVMVEEEDSLMEEMTRRAPNIAHCRKYGHTT